MNTEAPELTSLQRLLQRVGPKPVEKQERRELPTSVVTHDSWDDWTLSQVKDESPKYRRAVVDKPPHVALEDEPEPIDIATATAEELEEYRAAVVRARASKEGADPYEGWEDLTDDLYRACHTHSSPLTLDQVHPKSELHKQLLESTLASDEFANSRPLTRDDKATSAVWVMTYVEELAKLLEEQLRDRVRDRDEREQAEQAENQAQEQIENILPPDYEDDPTQVTLTPEQEAELEAALDQREEARAAAGEGHPNGLTLPVIQAVEQAAEKAKERAEEVSHLPSFGSGLGMGEPVYENSEQQIRIAEIYAGKPELRQMVEMAGREKSSSLALRAKRAEGGMDEPVDIGYGDDLAKVTPDELALLASPETEDQFFAHMAAGELMVFEYEGEEEAAHGPIGFIVDGSGSMRGPRNIRARATCLAWLHVARQSRRDFFVVEFSAPRQVKDWIFPIRKALDPEMVLDMASHLFKGGTAPLGGIKRGQEIMARVPAFEKADLVLCGDGDAQFTPADEQLREELRALGVRIFGIAIGELTGGRSYLHQYAEHVVDVHDFELGESGANVTRELATHIT